METLLYLLSIYLIGFIWINFEPIQDKLLMIDSIWIKPLKCMKCLFFWTSLVYTIINIYLNGFDIRDLFMFLVLNYISIKIN
jgi:hypothetical protein